MAILKNIDSYIPNANPLAWMLQISKNITINVHNKNSRIDLNPFPINREFYTNNTENKDILAYLLSNIDCLSRRIVILHLVGGYKHKEIAQMLNIPITSVHWRYQAAIKKLRTVYEKECL